MLLAAEQLQKDEAQFIELFEAVQKAALRGGTSVLGQLMQCSQQAVQPRPGPLGLAWWAGLVGHLPD